MSKWGRLGILICLLFTTQVWASIGKVSLLKGEATANRDNQTITLANGTTLEEHDIITTRANSQIQLIFEDKTVITLGSESVLDIKEYLNDAQEPKAKFKFSQGTFKSITGQIGKKAPENFNLQTKTATIGIRGTTVVGQIGQGEAPDIIGCSVGQIVVNNPSGVVTLSAGFATMVAPGQPPTPPMPLSATQLGTIVNNQTPPPPAPQATTSPASSAPTFLSETTNNITSQAHQNTVKRDIEKQTNSIHVPFTPSKGLVVFDYITNSKGSIKNYSKNQDGIFYYDTTASLYTLNTTTGVYGTTSSTLSTVLPSEISSTSTINNTNFVLSEGNDNTNAIDISAASLSYSAQLIHDSLNEILIAKISAMDGNSVPYTQTMLIGDQSTTLSSDPVLYYLNSNYLFNNSEVSSILQNSTDFTTLAVNTTNQKALGIFLDENGQLQINLGNVDSHESVSLQQYALAFDLTSLTNLGLSAFHYQNSNGALYGSDNQAFAVSGMKTSYISDGDSTSYASAINIALKNSAAASLFHQDYSNHEVLTGSMIDGTGTVSDLSITLNKNTGTVSVSSTPLTIASTHSAYIYDDYFATLSTGTYKDTTILKDYLIAIPLEIPTEFDDNDYVSWGYWGKNNITTNSVTAATSPFSTWVAGVKTDASVIQDLVTNSAVYSYSGKVIGAAYEGGVWGSIKNDGSNLIDLHVNFANANPITGNIAFNTSNNTGLWNSTVTTSTLTAATSSFAANLSGGNSNGSLNSNFYGPTANAVAGNFNLAKTATPSDIAVGSFKASYVMP